MVASIAGVALRLSCPAAGPPIRGSSTQLLRVLYNFSVFGGEGGGVVVGGRSRGGRRGREYKAM